MFKKKDLDMYELSKWDDLVGLGSCCCVDWNLVWSAIFLYGSFEDLIISLNCEVIIVSVDQWQFAELKTSD